jgi:hypothetical protein
MYRIIQPDGKVFWQMELGDNSDPHISHTFKYKKWLKKGFIAAIQRYYSDAIRAHRKDASEAPSLLRQYKQLTLFPSADLELTTMICDVSICVQLQPCVIQEASKSTIGQQTQITAYISIGAVYLNHLSYRFIDRFRRIPAVVYEDFAKGCISLEEWILFQELPSYTGLFIHLFLLNPTIYWVQLETILIADGYKREGFSVFELIVWIFLLRKLGLRFFSVLGRMGHDLRTEGLQPILSHPDRVPQPYHFSHLFQYLKPEHLLQYFWGLVEEGFRAKLIEDGILMGDGVSMHSWAGNFTKTKLRENPDPEASLIVHNKQFRGKGYVVIVLSAWCRSRWLPIYFEVFSGSTSEKVAMMIVFRDFMRFTNHRWKVYLYDGGGYSADNRSEIKGYIAICAIPAPENLVCEPTVILKERGNICEADFPDGISQNQFRKLLDHRAQQEAEFSPLDMVFVMKHMNRRGLDAAYVQFCIYCILLWQIALSALKVNRENLIMKATAFNDLNPRAP